MSHNVELDIVVIGLAALVEAVIQCGYDHAEARQFQTDDGQRHKVDLVIEDHQGGKVGVKVDPKTQAATFIAYDCQGTQGRKIAQNVAQRWAYSRVTEELRRKGYTIAKEEKQADGSIKIVAGKWR
jgi:Protein of unknown function (DUF1257)